MLHAPARPSTRAAFPGHPATDAPPTTYNTRRRLPLSTKGQLVIPQEIRGLLGVRPGDRIDFVVAEDGTVTLRPALLDVRDLRGLLRREGAEPVSVEAMSEAIRLRHGGS